MQAQQPQSNITKRPRVLVFDSGVGGLSISREIVARSEAIELHYLSDNAAFPYGEKTTEELINRASRVLLSACEQLQPNIVVIACNTASTAILPSLRTQLAIPVVGVVPAIKSAAKVSKSQTIALLATPGTVNRNYTQQLINEHAANHQVIRLGSSQLVKHIEAHIHGQAIDSEYLLSVVEQLTEQVGGENIDTVVLGCTHFPLISEYFKAIKSNWQWIDSGAAIAERVHTLLNLRVTDKDTRHTALAKIEHQLWLTQASAQQSTLDSFIASYIADHSFSASRILTID
ncbi:MAG: glutamate racemase [Pseudomonadales bacterium]